MDSRLKQLVLDDVVDKWHKGARPVKSADVYQNLVNVGEDIPAGAMVEILNALKHQNLIEGGLVAHPFSTIRRSPRTGMWKSRGLIRVCYNVIEKVSAWLKRRIIA